MLTPMTKMFSSPCDANVNNDIHDEDEDGVGGYPVVSTRLIVIVCLSRQKTRPGREHTLPYDEEDYDDEDDLQELVVSFTRPLLNVHPCHSLHISN